MAALVIGLAALCALLLAPAFGQEDWTFGYAYPPHYRTLKLAKGSSIVIDGDLNEEAWESVPWTASPFVDITHHANSSENIVPPMFQARVKVRWDDAYLYVGAVLQEPFVFGNIVGHNKATPYTDNDFEVFVDVSRTTEYYKEYEMNALNATYDVLWGVPDGADLQCDSNGRRPYLPVCVNTSFPGYAGSWSMMAKGGGGGGLASATRFNKASFGQFRAGNNWSLEIAFPIHPTPTHGGLLSTGGGGAFAQQFSPSSPPQGRPLYWAADFSRAEHPREFTLPGGGGEVYCPYNCSDPALPTARPTLHNPSQSQCAAVRAAWPTLLGIYPWSCYWEWVWSAVGPDAYMHRPLFWGLLEFAPATAPPTATCRDIEFPGRYLARQLYYAQLAFNRSRVAAGLPPAFAPTAALLLSQGHCVLPLCSPSALSFALGAGGAPVFSINMTVIAHAAQLSAACTARPCFTVSVRVRVPSSASGSGSIGSSGGSDSSDGSDSSEGGRDSDSRGGSDSSSGSGGTVYTIHINENRRMTAQFQSIGSSGSGSQVCLSKN